MLEKNAYLTIAEAILSVPNQAYSVRDIARLTKLSPASASIHLRSMLASKMLTQKTIGRSHQYQANLDHPMTRQLKILFNLDLILSSNLLPVCRSGLKDIMGILLYGSMAKGTNDSHSDVDILILTATKNAHAPDPSQFDLGKEVNCLVYSYDQWKSAFKTNKEFYDQVMHGSIELEGQTVRIE